MILLAVGYLLAFAVIVVFTVIHIQTNRREDELMRRYKGRCVDCKYFTRMGEWCQKFDRDVKRTNWCTAFTNRRTGV